MKLRVFSLLICLLSGVATHAQFRVSGQIFSREDSTAIKGVTIYTTDGSKTSTTDARGNFLFEDLANGQHTLHVVATEFKYNQTSVVLDNVDAHLTIYLDPRTETLETVTVSDVANNFGFTRMRSVENMGIYEGKKTEVILPSQLTANLATNNARQAFSRVAGLNIWENDGAGLQLSIGGRGLDPNRTSNFNVRQNGYDISADALGYPESYYTPPLEAVERIEIIRGAASLQYGTQFGGLLNFITKKPSIDKKLELTARQTVGSFGFVSSFLDASGTVNKVSYYAAAQYKFGDGFRENSQFNNHFIFGKINYTLSNKTKIGVDVTRMGYLAQQPGGLSQQRFDQNPKQSIRDRNWFKVDWNMLAIHLDHKLNQNDELNLRIFGLSANRYAVGFRNNRVDTPDDGTQPRELIKGDFENWGAEARYLHRYKFANTSSALLVGTRYYHGFNHSTQGMGSVEKDADFNYGEGDEFITYDFRFPNRNISAFMENVFFINDKLSITPGIRYEYISTTADGYYGNFLYDLAGNIYSKTKINERRTRDRQLVIAGIGFSYKPKASFEVYANASQNYRSITFSDMRMANPSAKIDQNLKDERGFSIDLGMRSEQTALYNYDVSIFHLNYNDRIGEIRTYDSLDREIRERKNIGHAIIQGVEAYGEIDVLGYLSNRQEKWKGVIFGNLALITSQYIKSQSAEAVGKNVEFVPDVNFKTGFQLGYGGARLSAQYMFLSRQFTDATNAREGGISEVNGIIPAYSVLDFSTSYRFKNFKIEASVNNAANTMYFTRRATGYPGPGILPSDGRGYFLTMQIKI